MTRLNYAISTGNPVRRNRMYVPYQRKPLNVRFRQYSPTKKSSALLRKLAMSTQEGGVIDGTKFTRDETKTRFDYMAMKP